MTCAGMEKNDIAFVSLFLMHTYICFLFCYVISVFYNCVAFLKTFNVYCCLLVLQITTSVLLVLITVMAMQHVPTRMDHLLVPAILATLETE